VVSRDGSEQCMMINQYTRRESPLYATKLTADFDISLKLIRVVAYGNSEYDIVYVLVHTADLS
jgi:hypothetical protein